MDRPLQNLAGHRMLVLVATAVVVVLAIGVTLFTGSPQKSATIYFRQVVNLYPGDDVRLMGVAIGTIDAVTPENGRVRVDIHYAADSPVPAGAGAVILAPTLVAGRFVQLAPARATGPQLPDGAVIDLDHTMVPVEWNEIAGEIDKLTRTLGPTPDGGKGAVTNLLDTTSANLDGNGADLHQTIVSLSQAIGTLADGRDDLFDTVRNLQTLVTALRGADDQVGQFNTRLADVSGVLANSSGELDHLLDTLDSSVQRIATFLDDHRDAVTDDLVALRGVAQTLADNRQALANLLQKAPTAISNLSNIYDPFGGSITGALALTNVRDPASLICSTIFSAGGSPQQCQQALGPLAELAEMDVVPLRANPLQRNGTANQVDAHPEPAPDPDPTAPPPAFDTRPRTPELSSLVAPGSTG